MFHTCKTAHFFLWPERPERLLTVCFFSQSKALRRRGTLQISRKRLNRRQMVLQKESRLRTPVQNVSVGKFDATADNLVGNVSGVGLQNHVIMTNIAKELFHLESMGFEDHAGVSC
jgi:hypothetical protein